MDKIIQPEPPQIQNTILFEGHGQFAREMLDDSPLKEGTRFLDENGVQSEKNDSKIVGANSLFWRSKERFLYFILLVCSFGLFSLLLNSMQKYMDFSFHIFTGSFSTILSFILGLFGLR